MADRLDTLRWQNLSGKERRKVWGRQFYAQRWLHGMLLPAVISLERSWRTGKPCSVV